MTQKTAAILLIGNEILSGRTQDKNLSFLARALNERGIKVVQARVVPDVESIIVSTVNELRSTHDYVFTTGGIGPTHDDITTASVAGAFGVPVIRHADAEARLRAHYNHDANVINETRLKMADVPEGAELIDNPVSAAPGFRMENVFVLAGIPKIAQAMFDHLKGWLEGGVPVLSRSLEINLPEGDIADTLNRLQKEYATAVDIGCYPLFKQGVLGATIVLRCDDKTKLDAAAGAVMEAITGLGGKWAEI